MPIPITPPIVVPAVSEETYDVWLYTDFHAQNLTQEGGDLVFTKTPMNSTTGKLLPEQAQGFRAPFWEAASIIPEAAAAMQLVLGALPLIEARFPNP